MSDYYVAEERAMAPGIAGEWPRVIPKPDNANGRLVKVEGVDIDKAIKDAEHAEIVRQRFCDIVPGLVSKTWEDIWERVRDLIDRSPR